MRRVSTSERELPADAEDSINDFISQCQTHTERNNAHLSSIIKMDHLSQINTVSLANRIIRYVKAQNSTGKQSKGKKRMGKRYKEIYCCRLFEITVKVSSRGCFNADYRRSCAVGKPKFRIITSRMEKLHFCTETCIYLIMESIFSLNLSIFRVFLFFQ